MTKRKPHHRQSFCVDEHITPAVAAVFRRTLPTIEAGKHHEFRGRDEREYLHTLYSRNIVFVTSDIEFIEDTYSKHLKHAGMVYIPNKMLESEKELFAEVAAVFVRGGCRDSATAFRGCTLYPAQDGVRIVKPREDSELAFSWAWLRDEWK